MHVSEYAKCLHHRGSANGSLNPVSIHPAELEGRCPLAGAADPANWHTRSNRMANTWMSDALSGRFGGQRHALGGVKPPGLAFGNGHAAGRHEEPASWSLAGQLALVNQACCVVL